MPGLTLRRNRFRYDAVTIEGTTVSGTVRASTRAHAREQLSVHRLELTALDDAPGLLQTEVTPERLQHRHLEGFVAQLSVFTRSGVPLPTALLVIADETEHRVLRRTATDLAQRLTAGETLGEAVDAHAAVLPSHVRGVLRSADAGGDLGRALSGLQEHLDRQAMSRRKLATALVYPGVVAAMALVTMGVLAGFALPRFATLFAEMGAEPPWSTRLVAGGGRWFQTWWPGVVTGLVIGALTCWWWLRSSRTARQRDRVVWRLPLVGRLVRVALAERLCRVVSLTTSAGVALPAALDVAADVSGNSLMRERVKEARDRLVDGDEVMQALDATGLFSAAARQILAVGVRTGTLEQQWGVAADLLGAEMDRRLQRLSALLEPALIVAVGIVVAGVAVSLVTALYGVVDQLGS